MKQISEALFTACTGRRPEQDDLERCNCADQGKPGHNSCGWNWTLSAPVFQVGREEE